MNFSIAIFRELCTFFRFNNVLFNRSKKFSLSTNLEKSRMSRQIQSIGKVHNWGMNAHIASSLFFPS
jgi:hypothetical protein